jgi:hypothetical protein
LDRDHIENEYNGYGSYCGAGNDDGGSGPVLASTCIDKTRLLLCIHVQTDYYYNIVGRGERRGAVEDPHMDGIFRTFIYHGCDNRPWAGLLE